MPYIYPTKKVTSAIGFNNYEIFSKIKGGIKLNMSDWLLHARDGRKRKDI